MQVKLYILKWMNGDIFRHFCHLQAISLYIHKFERKYSGIFEGSCMFYTVRFIVAYIIH